MSSGPSKRRCPFCGEAKVQTLAKEGMIVCGNDDCGVIISQNELAAEVGFNESSTGQVSISGTMIGSHSTGLTMSKNGSMFQRGDSREATIMKGQSAVRDVARRIPGFPSRITTIACRYFEGAVNNGFTKGRTRDHVAAACLFMSCRLVEVGSGEKGQPFMLMDFSTVIKISVFELGMIYLKLVNKFKFQNKISHQDPSLYIDRWARLLEFDPLDVSKVAEDACNLVMGFKRDWMAEGRKPSGICGAALLLAARMNNYHRTMHEIIQVVKVSDSTINKRLQEFKDTASSTLTVEEFRSAWSKGPDFWEGMAQPLPPAKMRNDALLEVEEKELKRSLKRERDENASDGDGSVENSDDTSEEEEDEEEEDQDGVQPGKKAMIAASKKMRANLRKVQLLRDKRDRLEMLRKARQTPTSSRADSMPLLPEGSPAPEGSASGSGNQELPNFKMDNVEPVYMGKKKEAEASALVRRERGKKDKGKGKEKEGEASGTQNGGKKKQTDQDGDVTMEDGDADKEEGDEALKRIDETDKEEGDQTDKEEGDQTDKEEGDQTDKEEGGETDHEYEQPRRPIQSRDDIVDPAVEREIQEALDQDLEFGTSADGQKEIKTAAQKMKELAAADKQKASRAAQAARGDWALGLDDEELDGYILDEYGFEAKKRIWWHNNRDYMVKRYEKKQKEDGLARPQTTGGRKRTKPGPAASAYDATMTMVKGKSFSRNINYEALRKAFQEDSDEEEEEKKLQAVNGSTPSSIKPAPRAEGSRSGLPAATSAGAESDKEEGPDANNAVTAEGEDKEEGDDDKDGEEDDKEDEDMDDEGYSEFAPVEEEFDGFEEAD